MKNKKYTVPKFKTEKVLRFLINGFLDLMTIIGSIAFLGFATAAGEEAKAEAPRSVINEIFATSCKKVNRQMGSPF